MSAGAASPLGFGLYFIDVLACLLFCIVLALVGARFGSEQTVEVDLPRMPPTQTAGSDLSGTSIALRSRAGATEVYLGEERVSFEVLEAKLAGAPPPSVVVRAEESALARVVAIAHAAGVHDIRLAYRAEAEEVR